VLYPDDNHFEGKSLRLKQQYFLVSASVQRIVRSHLKHYGTLDNIHEKKAIQLNDTHPALVVPELMRILMDDHGYSWDRAWLIVTNTVSYTNHTVMPEALEQWPEALVQMHIPRILGIIHEINERACRDLLARTGDADAVSRMAIVRDGVLHMANMSVIASAHVNGVSALHSRILQDGLFHDFYRQDPGKFLNVTNGIAHRRWLCQANPGLSSLIGELCGTKYMSDAAALSALRRHENDAGVLDRLNAIKHENKLRLADYIRKTQSITVDPGSIFDVQAKRLHEYKRQLMNVLHIISLYNELLDNPGAPIHPRTFLFAAKASPGYDAAKRIIHLICRLADAVNRDSRVRDRLKVVFLEDYRVTLAEEIIPAADLSEQISTAGKEASGTGNMKFMMNGALTIGTLDGANVEIHDQVGDENMFLFGLHADEAEALQRSGYTPSACYQNSPRLKSALDALGAGLAGERFNDVSLSLLTHDAYMLLADFDSYADAQKRAAETYTDRRKWSKMALINIAGSGVFSADRSVGEYARKIWGLEKVR
jgi:starch phosphorylase